MNFLYFVFIGLVLSFLLLIFVRVQTLSTKIEIFENFLAKTVTFDDLETRLTTKE